MASAELQADGGVAPSPALRDRAFFGHPRGLAVISFTEAWSSFSFYGMQSLLVLYLTGQLLKPGHVEHVFGFPVFKWALEHLYGPLSGQPLAAAIMGLYAALIYATPIFAGLLADRVLGRTRTIVLGVVLMTTGHFLMAFDFSFLIALACLIAGAGCASSLKAQVGGLYPPGDLRRADAFQVFVLGVQISVIFAPLVCGTLGEKVAWHWGFGAAGVGMLIGLVIYLGGRKWLPPEPPLAKRGDKVVRPPLKGREWRTLAVLALLLPILALVAVGNNEIFNAYPLWGQAHLQLEVMGHAMPVSWLLSLDALVSTATLALSVLFWRWWATRRREPDEIVKLVIGASFLVFAPMVLAAASFEAQGGHKVGLGWALAFHIVNDLGFANVYAVGMALFSRAAPPSLGATVVNAYSLHLFLANLLVGWLAGFLSRMPGVSFWLMHSAIIAAATVLLMVFASIFHRTLAPGGPSSPT